MINGLDPLTALSLLTLASLEPTAVCEMPKPTQINVIPHSAELKIDKSQTLEEIQKYEIDTVNPYGFEAQSHTKAFMRGGVGLKHEVHMDYKHVLSNRAVCIWYDQVDLIIEITPEIVIAKELTEVPCEYNVTLEHEMKHVAVDRKVVNKYAKTMGKKVFDGLKSRGFMVGPVRAEAAQDIINRMQDTVGQLVELEYKKMQIERQEMQQAVDSLEEYQRVNSACDQATSASRSRR